MQLKRIALLLLASATLAWARTESERTTSILEADPHYPSLHGAAIAAARATDRIATPAFIGGEVYNFWQDAAHTRGVWRRTTITSYRSTSPTWTTVLDVDSLAAAEKANWVWKFADCTSVDETRCLVFLSDGGEDAVTIREFDLATGRFAAGGFVLPRSRQHAVWAGRDTILVSREWNSGEVTRSSYPMK